MNNYLLQYKSILFHIIITAMWNLQAHVRKTSTSLNTNEFITLFYHVEQDSQ